ncbi:HdeD family acid-resistance protein [Rhodopirellula sallentina]|uniref:Putative membrane protein n=1 Tax=Rhodopirellula sallentina SM41 TaxID=1263870 RepID=M5UFS2_9BACT|nr:HdeD family acid-resistance protein [Rhodopirellula sallentina]EMI54853.1 putative membrane protein [Rhodopirellula sallentina SM41]
MTNDSLQPPVGPNLPNPVVHELNHMRKEWWCFLIVGILLVLSGIASIAYPWFTSIGVVVFLGALLIVSGITTVISAFWARHWNAFFLQILIGIVYTVTGFVITDAPLTSLALLTLMLAGFFVIAGAFRIVTALVLQFPQWGWHLFNGLVTAMLGLIIFRSFRNLPEEPSGVLWIIGLLVGMELLLNGWTWVVLALALRKLPETEASSS